MANAGVLLIVTSMFTDTVYYGETEDGSAVEGSYAGLWQASEKFAFALGPLIAGIILSVCGFESSRTGTIAQPDSALFGLLLNYSLVPIALFVVSLLFVPAFNRSVRVALSRR